MPVWLSPWEYTTADWAGLQFIVLVVAAAVAWRQVREARQLREARAEPFVVVDFEVEQNHQGIYLVISNIGATMARDVKLTFDPELTSSLDSDGDVVPPRELKPLRDGIPSLAPGKRIVVMLDVFTQRKQDVYPDLYRVHVTFYAPTLKRQLSDDTILDLGLYRNVLHPIRHDLHDVHERLKELVTEIRKWRPPGTAF